MSYQKIAEIRTKWTGCKRCVLGEKSESGEVCIGMGSVPADILIVVPAPSFKENETLSPMMPGTPEAEMFKMITDKVGIDRQKVYITSSVGCSQEEDVHVGIHSVIQCRSRLVDIVQLINPKVVVLLGPEAMFSWTGDNIQKEEMGLVDKDEHRTCFWTHDFSRYIKLKETDPSKAQLVAQEIFDDWRMISDVL